MLSKLIPNIFTFHKSIHLSFTSADLIKDDGIYSVYFTQFDPNGQYGIQANVRAAQNKSFINYNNVIDVGNLQNGGSYVVNGSDSIENDRNN